jgi:hypothetical protein
LDLKDTEKVAAIVKEDSSGYHIGESAVTWHRPHRIFRLATPFEHIMLADRASAMVMSLDYMTVIIVDGGNTDVAPTPEARAVVEMTHETLHSVLFEIGESKASWRLDRLVSANRRRSYHSGALALDGFSSVEPRKEPPHL